MKLYLVRHGMSLLNEKRVHQHNSTELSEEGLAQAKRLAARFRTIPIDIVLSSHYRRAEQTAEIIADTIGKPIEISPIIHEVKRPSIIEGRGSDEPDVVAIKALIEENLDRPDWHHSDEESLFDVRLRASAFLRSLDDRREENLLVVTHGTFMRMLIAVMLNGPEVDPRLFLKYLSFFISTNTGLTICQKDLSDPWRMVTWNDQAHLGE